MKDAPDVANAPAPKIDLAALRNPTFRLVAAAQIGFVAAEQVLTVAVTISVLDAGGDASAVGLVLAGKGIASVALLLLGGVWSDRLSRRKILIVTLAVDAIAALVPTLGVPHRRSIVLLAGALFLMGAAESFVRPALNGILKGTLGETEQMSGRALINICTRLGVIVGPVTGTALASHGEGPAFIAAAVLFAFCTVVFRFVREPRWAPQPRRPLLAEARSGLVEAWRRPWLAALLLFSPVSLMFVIAPSQVLLPVLSQQRFASTAGYGIALTIYGVGGLVGNTAMMAWRPRRPGVVAMCSMSLYALVPLALCYATSPVMLVCCYLVAGCGVETYALLWDVAVLREIPDRLLGRITSLTWLSTFGLMPFGQALTGPLTNLVGTTGVLLGAAFIVLITPPCLLFVRGMARMRVPTQSGGRNDSAGRTGRRRQHSRHPC